MSAMAPMPLPFPLPGPRKIGTAPSSARNVIGAPGLPERVRKAACV
jgi:hypothetical protein